MSEQTATETPARRKRLTPAPAPGRPTLPATDAANPESPLTLSPDALEGTRDRAMAMGWTDEGFMVRRRADGVYERVHVPEKDVVEDETFEFYPDVEMLDRRVLDPSLNKDIPILFRDEVAGRPPKYYKRWVDTWTPNRLAILTQSAHYKQAEWDMLKNKDEIGSRYEGTKTDPYVRSGEKGRYMLLFMPYGKWMEIKTAQANIRTKRERTEMTKLAASQASGEKGIGAKGAEAIDTMFRGKIQELPPQSLETFQGSGLPKDIAGGADAGVTVLDQ